MRRYHTAHRVLYGLGTVWQLGETFSRVEKSRRVQHRNVCVKDARWGFVNLALSKGDQLGLNARKIYLVTQAPCEQSLLEVLLALGRKVWMKTCSEAQHSSSAHAQ